MEFGVKNRVLMWNKLEADIFGGLRAIKGVRVEPRIFPDFIACPANEFPGFDAAVS
jgi:hypothetical protein